MSNEYMPIDAVNGGLLDIGERDSLYHFADIASEARFSIEESDADPLPVLSGKKIPSNGEKKSFIEAKIYDDFGLNKSIKEYLINNSGKVVDFTFRPYGSRDQYIVGQMQLKATGVGGAVGERPQETVRFPVLSYQFKKHAQLDG